MKAGLASLLLLASVSVFAQGPVSRITCKGYVSFKNGTMEGDETVVVEHKSDDTWTVQGIDAGKNKSSDENILLLDTYGWFLKRRGAYARFDFTQNTLEFKYKYDSGFEGGGVQRTAGTFSGCSIE